MTTLTQTSIQESFRSEDSLNTEAIHISKALINNVYNISDFVEKLGFALTSSSVDERVGGTKLLSCVLSHLPKDLLNETQLEFLMTFYADRCKDNHNVIPAVIVGIDAMISMQYLPHQDVPKLLNSFFQNTSCQSQVRNDRAKLFRIFKYLSEHYTEELKSMAGDFIYGIINSIDGERDPRNLDFVFTFMPDFISTIPLLHLSEEMFEIFACYFPIDFNPTMNDPDTITRDNLSSKLTKCLVASPDFIEWTIALALEKLSSDLVVAKLDSLELLYQAAIHFEPKLFEKSFEEIWSPLKNEIFPGSDNAEIVAAGLKALRGILAQAKSVPEISKNYQTTVLGTILSHLSDVNQRLFNPSTAIALVCIAGDAQFSGEKILSTFWLKLNATEPIATDQRIRIYTIIAQLFKVASVCNDLEQINSDVCGKIHADVIAALRCEDLDNTQQEKVDLIRSALSVLNECTLIINEVNRALVFRELVQLITHSSIDLEFTHFLEQLGALHPIELQSHCIGVLLRNFTIYSSFVKAKIYKNLLPLVKQIAFTELIMDLMLSNIFKSENINDDARLLALKALNSLISTEDHRFIEHLQNDNCLIDKLITLGLAQSQPQFNIDILEQISIALSLLVQQLPIAEQYMIASEYLPKLNLQIAADLFVAKGLLGFLHKDISLDDHFECLLNDLTKLSLESDNEHLRQVAHHLLCSLVNKIDYNESNRSTVKKFIHTLKEEIVKENVKAIEVLSWLAKGLNVRGCEDVGDIIEELTKLLDHPSLSHVALLAFDIISAEYPELHLPVIRFLFKQKFFHIVLCKLGHKLQSYSEQHMNAFLYVLKTTPHAVIKMNIEQIGPILFKSLELGNTQTICISLEISESFIKVQDEYFRSHLNHIIPSCLRLSTFKESMKVRIIALNLLHDITRYPTFVLLPYKMDVVLELAMALDDTKRLVRNVAVRARNSWFLIGSPNTSEP